MKDSEEPLLGWVWIVYAVVLLFGSLVLGLRVVAGDLSTGAWAPGATRTGIARICPRSLQMARQLATARTRKLLVSRADAKGPPWTT